MVSGTFYNFFLNISDPWLVESVDAKLENTKGYQYSGAVTDCWLQLFGAEDESLLGAGSEDNGRDRNGVGVNR